MSPAQQRSLPWIILIAGLIVALAAWQAMHDVIHDRARVVFESDATQIATEIKVRLASYEQVLRSGVALHAASDEVTQQEWLIFRTSQDIERRFPGILGTTFAPRVTLDERDAFVETARRQIPGYAIKPPGDRPDYAPILLLAPVIPENRSAVGFDLYSDPLRREAMIRARDSGQPAASARIRLASDRGPGNEHGFSMFLPVYRDAAVPTTIEARRTEVTGYLTAAFRVVDMMDGVLGSSARLLTLTIHDSQEPDSAALLYDSDLGEIPAEGQRFFEHVVTVGIGGRDWTLRFTSKPAFESERETAEPALVLGGAVAITLALWLMTLFLTHDLTRRREAEASLREAEHLFRGFFEHAPVAMYLRLPNGQHIFANEPYARVRGVPRSQIIGTTVRENGSPFIVPENSEQRDRLILDGKTVPNVERNYTDSDGRDRVVLNMKFGIPDEKGAVAAICGIQLDVTDSKRLEEQLVHAQRLEAVGQLTGGLAHDFNNLLQIILGNAQLLVKNTETQPGLSRLARAIERASLRGAELTKRMLAFSRRQALNPANVDLNATIRHMEELFHRTLGEHIEIKTVYHEPAPVAFVDGAQLENAILNLVVNARDAMPKGGRLVIETGYAELDGNYVGPHREAAPGRKAVISVSDTGDGIPADRIEQVFEPFYTTKETGKGSGLGLSMVYGFVNQSDGHVAVYSEVGHGTILRIYLPPADGPRIEDTVEDSVEPTAGATGDETILLVEDDAGVRTYVSGQLSRKGYKVIEAENGPAALERLAEHPETDLLFTDMIMPGGMTGLDLANEARKQAPGIAVLFTSGYTGQTLFEGIELDGTASLLSKPYKDEALSREVRRALNRAHSAK